MIYTPPPRRPRSVTLLAVVVLIFTTVHLVRFYMALSRWEFLATLPRVSPLYLTLTGLIWTLLGLPLTWGLWRGWPGIPKVMRLLAPAYALYWWLERIALTGGGETWTNWPFSIGVSILLLLTVYWTFSRPRVKAYFGELHEQSI